MMRKVWFHSGRWTLLLLVVGLAACSKTATPPVSKEAPSPPQLKMTQAEFLERFSKLPVPAPVSRIEYLYGVPHEKEMTAEQKAPALYRYRCRDGEMWISFGADEGTYGALACHEGSPAETERNAAREAAERGVGEVHERALRQGLAQKERRIVYVQERLIENRDRVLALRGEQAAFAEAEWQRFQENLNRYRETERQRLLKACPAGHSAAQVEQELKHRNIRLQTLFRDEFQAFHTSLNEKQRDADDKVRVMRQSLERGRRELAQLNGELKALCQQLGTSPATVPLQEPPAMPDEAPFLERWQAITRGIQDLQAPALTAEDATAKP